MHKKSEKSQIRSRWRSMNGCNSRCVWQREHGGRQFMNISQSWIRHTNHPLWRADKRFCSFRISGCPVRPHFHISFMRARIVRCGATWYLASHTQSGLEERKTVYVRNTRSNRLPWSCQIWRHNLPQEGNFYRSDCLHSFRPKRGRSKVIGGCSYLLANAGSALLIIRSCNNVRPEWRWLWTVVVMTWLS